MKKNRPCKKTVLIEKYLNGELSPKQRRHVEKRIAKNPAFAADVRLHREINEAIAEFAEWYYNFDFNSIEVVFPEHESDEK